MLLDQFLAALDIGVSAFTACDVRTGWQLVFDPCRTASLHYCLAGEGAIRVGDGASIPLRQHSFVLLPPGVVYSIGGSAPDNDCIVNQGRLRAPPLRESVPRIQAGDGEPAILTACGEVQLAHASTPDLFASLEGPLVEHFDGPDGLRDQFVMLLAESAQPRIGTRALTEALLKQCFTLLLRRQMERGTAPLPWLAGLADPRMARVLSILFERLSESFTVETLAQVAGMSRSAFAARFSETFGQPPMLLFKALRLHRARELLATTRAPVANIARSVGFSSRSNFSQAFRSRYGVDPTNFRADLFETPGAMGSSRPGLTDYAAATSTLDVAKSAVE